jgi:hypothetical protein
MEIKEIEIEFDAWELEKLLDEACGANTGYFGTRIIKLKDGRKVKLVIRATPA